MIASEHQCRRRLQPWTRGGYCKLASGHDGECSDLQQPDLKTVKVHAIMQGTDEGPNRCVCWHCVEARRLGIAPKLTRFGLLEVD